MSSSSWLRDFTTGYLECALWSSTDDNGEPLDAQFELMDINGQTIAEMAADCASFVESFGDIMSDLDASQCGHDFWLTRNRHGAGFWDRGLGDLGDHLTEMAHGYGSYDLYIGDDGQVYGS